MTFDEALRSQPGEFSYPLHVSEYGSGQPLILLHGFAQTSYAFRYVVPELAKEYRVITVDLKGFGDSVKPHGPGYSLYHQALVVLALIEELKLDRVVLAGHSFGGGVALALTLLLNARSAGKQAGLIHIDGMCYDQTPPIGIELLRKPLLPYLAWPLLALKPLLRWGMQRAYLRPDSLTDDAVNAYVTPLRSNAGKRAVIRVATELRPPDADEFVTRYTTIRVPTLILWGQQDRIVPLAHGQRLARELPHAELVVLEDCGHCPHEEKPQDTLAAIVGFLRQLPGMIPKPLTTARE